MSDDIPEALRREYERLARAWVQMTPEERRQAHVTPKGYGKPEWLIKLRLSEEIMQKRRK